MNILSHKRNIKRKNKLNPPIKQGKVSRYVTCDSKMHWTKSCQHKRPKNTVIVETSEEKRNGR